MTRSLGWGLVGASTIAHEWVIDAIRAVPDNDVVAVFSTDPERGARYASSHRIPSAYASLSALVPDPQVGAVYVSTTNEMHRAQTVEAAAAGNHALCAEPVEVIALSQQAGMASGDIEDGAMTTIRFNDGVVAQLHDAFTVPFARTGIEVHGSAGSIFARDVMTQRPIGEVVLRTQRGEEIVPLEQENLYIRTIQAFAASIRGEGQPSRTGEDGLRSLATALAALESARTGRRVPVQFG